MSAPPTAGDGTDPRQIGQRWYEAGLKFRCTACGNCCRHHGEYAYVYLLDAEAAAIAGHLGLALDVFLERYCRREDGWLSLHIDQPACPFLAEDSRCGIYAVRPVQCRTWPFWEHTLRRREIWEREVRPVCPGVADGALHGPDEVEAIARASEDWYMAEEGTQDVGRGPAPQWRGPEPRG